MASPAGGVPTTPSSRTLRVTPVAEAPVVSGAGGFEGFGVTGADKTSAGALGAALAWPSSAAMLPLATGGPLARRAAVGGTNATPGYSCW